MRNILKKLHIVRGQSDDADGSPPSRGSRIRSSACSAPLVEQKPLSSLSSWLNSVASKPASSSGPPSASSSSSVVSGGREERRELIERQGLGRELEAKEAVDPDLEEEHQIQLALELSAREDPEAVQIEAVKQISLGPCPSVSNPAEVLAYRYWNYNALSYDDKILDGFYDLYGILADSSLLKMPSLIDLQGMPVASDVSWDAVIVNRPTDTDLLKLEQRALELASEAKPESLGYAGSDLVRKLAVLVSDYMGGTVCDPDSLLVLWMKLSNFLRARTGNMVLPLGHLSVGLARHRALLFKVLADGVGIPCQLLKGQQFTGSEDGAVNIVKFSDGKEYIVDLMAAPGTLIPSDGAGLVKDFEETFFLVNSVFKNVMSPRMASSNSSVASSLGCYTENEPLGKKAMARTLNDMDNEGVGSGALKNQESLELNSLCPESSSEVIILPNDDQSPEQSMGSNRPHVLARSPSWTEGASSPAVRRMKVKDVSQYMIEAAKENPQLAQKLHDVLLESGVVAPPNLFTEIYSEEPDPTVSDINISEDKDEMRKMNNEKRSKTPYEGSPGTFLPPLPRQNMQRKVPSSRTKPEPLKPIEGLELSRSLVPAEAAGFPCSSQSETPGVQSQGATLQFIKNMPVAAAAATAAVVASSMVVAAAKSSSDIKMEVPVAAAATATAAAVVATTAAVSRQYEHSGSSYNLHISLKSQIDTTGNMQVGSDHPDDCTLEQEHDISEIHQETERSSDRSTGNDSVRSDIALDEVADCEIQWEDLVLGERIGLGSFGEVYRGEWHGTEVAIKKFLHQDLSGDALEEFKSEVRIMKKLRHPNVVLFMGAVTRVPNLSIVTEFLPRGSLFRLIHRPNNQLDERRRLKMALDVARGMNYLHNCTPMIVHRDLKSPNLLVDKSWVVKVCDFGLSRMKHSTFLSSRSTAGTAEWMAPEVLRNEPSDEKCDVFSFGVILWELCTLQQPWGGMNPMQVVGAVGFQYRHLDIPDDMDPAIADIIIKCWQTNPKLRPSFSDIMAALKPLQKSLSSGQTSRHRAPAAGSTEKERS
ncbi:probable serine/threonine-protein kinase SIS8 isoform X1 [Dioscorea cayenensis subsp. rotundata]|uniref:non-specific serine/threonine protein kinase n=2 Tax=Dioscorea cayennensis subsp. rotundata TaxID=55577 RepID=A0AB40D1V5_DIOCR|nr:probable serine/threonine-protein kinase SIS8 isoform X1 [Dioscorea cayenensis subsp. rotundata]